MIQPIKDRVHPVYEYCGQSDPTSEVNRKDSKGEIHRRKLRSNKYQPPAGRLLENYESDSSVEADEDTDTEAGVEAATDAMKSWCKTRSTVAKKSASAVAVAISAVKPQSIRKRRGKDGPHPPSRCYSDHSDASLAGGRVGR
jgi:DNA-binding transcriptional regulator YdaS (Cro superfamily)